MKLITVKEYAKQEGISEQGARKRVVSGFVPSMQLGDNLHVAVEDNSVQVIKDLRAKIKLLNSNIKGLKEKAVAVAGREEEVQYLRDRMKQLEDDLRASTEKKEELYEKVINVVMLPGTK